MGGCVCSLVKTTGEIQEGKPAMNDQELRHCSLGSQGRLNVIKLSVLPGFILAVERPALSSPVHPRMVVKPEEGGACFLSECVC